MQNQAFFLSKSSALKALEAIVHGEEPNGELPKPYKNVVEVPLGFQGLHDRLLELCESLPKPSYARQPCPEFEAQASILVHTQLRNLPSALLGSAEFWMWLTIYCCRDIVKWRHLENPKYHNYGVEDKFEGLLCRLFFRSHLVYDSNASDPYSLARKGSQDFWRSFMIRRNYANVPTMARAFAEYVNFNDAEGLSDDEIRILGPKITQLNGSFSYEFMSDEGCKSFVATEATRLSIYVKG